MSAILNNCKFLQYLDTKQEYLLRNCHILLHSVVFKLYQLISGNRKAKYKQYHNKWNLINIDYMKSGKIQSPWLV